MLRATLLRAACLWVLLLPTPALAQGVDVAGLSWHHLRAAGAGRVGVVLAWPVGAIHDPSDRTGFAQATRALLELCQRDIPERERFVAETHDRLTLLWAAVPVQKLSERLGFLARLLSGRLEISDDLHALALARARLLADDDTRLYPGSALYNKAHRVLYGGKALGRQPAGIPAEIARITRADLMARYQNHHGTRGAVLVTVGDVDPERLLKLLRKHLPAPTGVNQLPAPVRPAVAKPVVREEIHPRVDGPYVTVAFRAPSPATPDAAFVVGVVAMRNLAQARFGAQRSRGEWRARFPFVRYDYLTGDPLVLVNRRGRNAVAPQGALQEIEGLLAAVRKHGPGQRDLEIAKREILNTLRRPWQGGQREVAFRARVLCVRILLGMDDDFVAQVQNVTAAMAQAALLDQLGADKKSDKTCRLVFLPEPTVKLGGFRTRGR